MIRCGHCGGAHHSVAEVRSCSDVPIDPAQSGAGGAPGERNLFDPPSYPAFDAPLPPRRSALGAAPTVVFDDSSLPLLAGPEVFGRWLIVTRGASAPAPWNHAPRVHITSRRLDGDLAKLLRTAYTERTRVVIEVAPDLLGHEPVLDTSWWELAADLELAGEALTLFLTANAVDLRDASPRFRPIELAIAAGAMLGSDTDIVLPDGRPAWCDGGSLRWFDDLDVAVIPACNLAHGVLTPLGDRVPSVELAPDQYAAVIHEGGGARIIAPAGSGKTRVLTERVRHLVNDRGIHPGAVCLVAFNVRAREEMEQRTRELPGIEVRTLNSLALAICNGTGPFATPKRHRRVSVIDEHQVRRILDELVSVRRQAMSDPIAAWIEALTASRLGLRSPTAVEQEFGGDVRGFAELAPRYVDLLRSRDLVDFDQQILRAIEILLTDTQARAVARGVCGQLLVDEFQDLTPAHVLLVRLLAGPRGEVFGVGDDDQTIYGYSGATPEWLIDFTGLFPGSTTHDLRVNYRCPPEVVEAAATLLTHNRRRVPKIIEAPPERSRGEALTEATSDDPAQDLVAHVQALIAGGAQPRDIAILTRVNATLLAPFIALSSAGVPTTKPVDAGFVERTGVAGALAWLDLATAPERLLPSEAIATAARRPPRALHPRVVDWMSEKASLRELEDLSSRMRDEKDMRKVAGFIGHLAGIRQLADGGADTRRILEAIRDDIGLGQALDTRLDASRRAVDRSSHSDDLNALLSIADLHRDPVGFRPWLIERLVELPHTPGGVRLSTVHRVKGREWPHVVVYDLTAGLFPHRLAESIEEERRVFHVALTRCSVSAHLLSGRPPSRFLAELAEPAAPDAPSDDVPKALPADRPAVRRAPAPPASTIEIAALRERLRSWRAQRAKADAVPAYVIFSDATLHELADQRPQSGDDLLTIKGIGPAKLDKYGDELLALVVGA